MADAIDTLYAEIEKAKGKGLMPKGGSSQMARRFGPRALLRSKGRSSGPHDWAQNARKYLGERKKGGAWRTWNADRSGKNRREGDYK